MNKISDNKKGKAEGPAGGRMMQFYSQMEAFSAASEAEVRGGQITESPLKLGR